MIWQACGRRGSGNQQKGFDVAVFVKMGLRAGLQGVPGGAQGAKGSLWCPAGREKTGKKRENPRRAGHGEQKEAFGAPPPKKKQGRREEIRGGRGMRRKKEQWCPAGREKTGKKREKLFWAGHRRAKRSSHTPPAINK